MPDLSTLTPADILALGERLRKTLGPWEDLYGDEVSVCRCNALGKVVASVEKGGTRGYLADVSRSPATYHVTPEAAKKCCEARAMGLGYVWEGM